MMVRRQRGRCGKRGRWPLLVLPLPLLLVVVTEVLLLLLLLLVERVLTRGMALRNGWGILLPALLLPDPSPAAKGSLTRQATAAAAAPTPVPIATN